jgi:hypothetical protein
MRKRARRRDGNPAAGNRTPPGSGSENNQRNQKIIMLMKEKERYDSPETEVMEFHSEGVVCASANPDVCNPFSGNNELEW